MSTGKAAGYLLAGVLAGVLVGMAVERSRTAGRLAVPADLPPDPCSGTEQATAVRVPYTPVSPVDTLAVPPVDSPVSLVDTPTVTTGDTAPFAQLAQGVRGADPLAEAMPVWQPDPDAVPALDGLAARGAVRAGTAPRGGRVARYLIRRVRRFLTAVGPAAGACALLVVALLAGAWRRRSRSAATWPTWLWVPSVLVPFGALVVVLRAELVAAVRCRPVRGPAGPAWCWPRAARGCVVTT